MATTMPTEPGPAIRCLVTVSEEILEEVGRPVDAPVRRVAVAAIVANPWHGAGYVADLQPGAGDLATLLGRTLARVLAEQLGGSTGIEALGKGVVVGLDGEAEHGAALIHTPLFADRLRDAAEGSAVIPSAEHRASAGTPLVVPLGHKSSFARRSHYQGVEIRVADAPRPGEIMVVAAASSGGRPNARIGDRTTDQPVEPAG